ncbi:MAG: helix-turn-helix domain-containing protein, partial [Myxococcota bacterium]
MNAPVNDNDALHSDETYWQRHKGAVGSADDPLTRRVLDVCEATGAFIEYWGFKGILGRVWTLLALRASPMPQTEIANLLGVSRSLVSGAIAELQRRGLVRAVGDARSARRVHTRPRMPLKPQYSMNA